MEFPVYQEKWLELKKGRISSQSLHQLSRQVASSFIDRYYQNGLYEEEHIALLCEMATCFKEPELNNIASSALFEIIVERLCDDFENVPLEIYSRVMCEVISYCRKVPAGKALDKQLVEFGVSCFEELYHRANAVQTRTYRYEIDKEPQRIILLSRVTIGADVATLSVIIQRLRRFFAKSEVVIIGSAKLQGLFGGNPCVRIRQLDYSRRGGLLERFSSWHSALDILAEEMPPGRNNGVLLIDPDSRITQLGVLPLSHEDNYLFFNSRNPNLVPSNECMAKLVNLWIDSVFGISDFCFPTAWIRPSVLAQARSKIARLHESGCRMVVAINLGVGQNPRKRLGIDFEKELLREVLKKPQTVIILDKGAGADEISRSTELMLDVEKRGIQTLNTRFDNLESPAISHGVVGIECAIGEISALISQCDQYIGYDSACQHIAAAIGTPTLTIFAGSNNMNFVRRWSACGNTPCRIVHVDTLTDPLHMEVNKVILRVRKELAGQISQPVR